MTNFNEYKHEWKFDLPWHMVNLKDWFYMVNVGHLGDVFLHVRILGIRSLWTFPEPKPAHQWFWKCLDCGAEYPEKKDDLPKIIDPSGREGIICRCGGMLDLCPGQSHPQGEGMLVQCICYQVLELQEGETKQCPYCGMRISLEHGEAYATGGELVRVKLNRPTQRPPDPTGTEPPLIF